MSAGEVNYVLLDQVALWRESSMGRIGKQPCPAGLTSARPYAHQTRTYRGVPRTHARKRGKCPPVVSIPFAPRPSELRITLSSTTSSLFSRTPCLWSRRSVTDPLDLTLETSSATIRNAASCGICTGNLRSENQTRPGSERSLPSENARSKLS